MKTSILAVMGIIISLIISCGPSKTNNQNNENNNSQSNIDLLEEESLKKPFTSTHIFVAEFEGITFYKCEGKTAMCPDQCGNSGNMANFKVVDYKHFIVNGEAGTEKLKDFRVLISDYYKNDLNMPYVPTIKNLKKGDLVTINLEFVYDTTKTTIQTITNIISITKN